MKKFKKIKVNTLFSQGLVLTSIVLAYFTMNTFGFFKIMAEKGSEEIHLLINGVVWNFCYGGMFFCLVLTGHFARAEVQVSLKIYVLRIF